MSTSDENNNITTTGKAKRHKSMKNESKDSTSRYFVNTKIRAVYGENQTCVSSSEIPAPSKKCNMRLYDSFFQQPCITLARTLLGKTLVRKLPSGVLLKGIIVETESYLGIIDAASHSFKGKRTERNEAMFLKPGTAYVYTIYGMYYCFNISSLEEGSAVLIRALEPVEGFSEMCEFRIKGRKCMSDIKTKDLCNGPSKLCQALQIKKNILNKVDLCTSNDLWLEEGLYVDSSSIICCKRIGIDSYGEEWGNKPLRFYIKDNSFVSQKNKAAERTHSETLCANFIEN